MSKNSTRRRHMHSRDEREAVRAREQFQEGRVPAVAGVVRNTSAAELDMAMEQAHDALPYVPGTQVTLTLYDVEPGIKFVAEFFGDETAVAVMTRLIECGPDARVIVCSRLPHECGPGHECGH